MYFNVVDFMVCDIPQLKKKDTIKTIIMLSGTPHLHMQPEFPPRQPQAPTVPVASDPKATTAVWQLVAQKTGAVSQV